MHRESNIPLFLWIATAVLAHLAWGGGVTRVSHIIEQTLDIKRFALAVQAHVRGLDQPFQVSLLTEPAKPAPPPPDPIQPKLKATQQTEKSEKPKTKTKPDEQHAKPKHAQRVAAKKPKFQLPKMALVKPKPAAKSKPAPPKIKLDAEHRIAVRQHVENPNQKDNPTATFIADQANKVAVQTQARITSTDQDDPHPTPGGVHSGPTQTPGDSYRTRIWQSENREGDPNRAPTPDSSQQAMVAPKPTPPTMGNPHNTPPIEAPTPKTQRGEPVKAPSPARLATQPEQKAQKAIEARAATPDTLHGASGNFAMSAAEQARRARAAERAMRRRLPPPRGSRHAMSFLGLGAPGTTKSGINLNLTPKLAFAAIGRDRLRQERVADARRRRSEHLGSWAKPIGIQRWRSAIENYVPTVRIGDATALNAARVPFATYLNAVHNRIHPIFAESFLPSLDRLPGSSPLNNMDIHTELEIAISQDDGHIVRMGVTKTSGVTAFDLGALESVQRASPFGAPPKSIVSWDGNVYLHWEFWRNPYYACSTYFARPLIRRVSPHTAPPKVEPPPKHEGDPKEDQQGSLRLKHLLEKRTALR
jgi:hypothetical protein